MDGQDPEATRGQIDPYMGISSDLIVLLHIATETAMLDFNKADNLFSSICIVIKMYVK